MFNSKALEKENQRLTAELEQQRNAVRKYEADVLAYGETVEREKKEKDQTIATLQSVVDKCGGGDVLAAQNALDEIRAETEAARQDHERARAEAQAELERIAASKERIEKEKAHLLELVDVAASINEAVEIRKKAESDRDVAIERLAHAKNELVDVIDKVNLQKNGLYEFHNPADESIILKDELDELKREYKQIVKDKQATESSANFTFNNSNAEGKKFRDKMERMALRSYNAEAENAIVAMKAGRLETAEKRLEKARDQVTKMGEMIDLKINVDYHIARMKELRLTARYLSAVQQAKELEREEKRELREQAKVEREMEAERKRLEDQLRREQEKYNRTVEALREQGREQEIEQLEETMREIQEGIEDVEKRRANLRCGTVYVISNIGSFGQRMVKIGMTRRQDPMDRVRELSDASVPFNFDVHLMHFSEDAVGVETALHRKFADKKVNLVNQRREFFYVTPEEVRDALMEIDDTIVSYNVEPEAKQFHESEEMRPETVDEAGRHSAATASL